MKQISYLPGIARIVAAGVLSAALLPSAFAGQAVNDAEARNQEIWREAIAQTEVLPGDASMPLIRAWRGTRSIARSRPMFRTGREVGASVKP